MANPVISRAHTKPSVQRNRDVKPPTPVSNMTRKFRTNTGDYRLPCTELQCRPNYHKQLQAKHYVEKRALTKDVL